MEVKSEKAQLMSLTLLILFLLMLSILLVFAELTTNYNNISQSVALSSTSADYATLLQPSVAALAKASAARALTVLANYEMQPNMRGGNFITNFNATLSTMISNAMVAGVSPSSAGGLYLSNSMGNLTLTAYDKKLLAIINSSYMVVHLNQTAPSITQYNPYNLSVTFTEKVSINTTQGSYNYAIPVNVSVPLAGTPDLYYAQRGVLQYINFSQGGTARNFITGQGHGLSANVAYAISGNTLSYSYGTIYVLPAQVGCAGSSNPIATYMNGQLTSAPLNKSIIIVTPDATFITNSVCNIANNFGGLITYKITNQPTVPWLEYANTGNQLQYFQTGEQVAIYGPLLAALNVSSLQSSFYNGYYYASPYAPSYASRVDGALTSANPQGLFNLAGANQQAGYFNGATSDLSLPQIPQEAGANSMSFTLWFDAASFTNAGASGYPVILGDDLGSPRNGYAIAIDQADSPSAPYLYFERAVAGVHTAAAGPGMATNTWYFVSGTYDGNTLRLYLNGTLVGTKVTGGSIAVNSGQNIGVDTGNSLYFDGSVADVQIYNTTLTGSQIQTLYGEGIGGVPIATKNLLGWWPLNGNGNDYSGSGKSGTPTSVAYGLPLNYKYDSIFSTALSGNTALPVPGIFSCSSFPQCTSNSLPHIYVGSQLLGVGGPLPVAQFNGATSYINIPASSSSSSLQLPFSTGAITLTAWFSPSSLTGTQIPVGFGTTQSSNCLAAYLELNGNSFAAGVQQQSVGTMVESISGLSTHNWYFGAMTFANSGNLIAYLNGASANTPATMTIDPASAIYNMVFGSNYDTQSSGTTNCGGGPLWFNGELADVQLYNVVLSANALGGLYHEGPGGPPVATASLVAWWPLAGNVKDYSGYGNNVTSPFASYGYNLPGPTYTASSWPAGTTVTQNARSYFGFT